METFLNELISTPNIVPIAILAFVLAIALLVLYSLVLGPNGLINPDGSINRKRNKK